MPRRAGQAGARGWGLRLWNHVLAHVAIHPPYVNGQVKERDAFTRIGRPLGAAGRGRLEPDADSFVIRVEHLGGVPRFQSRGIATGRASAAGTSVNVVSRWASRMPAVSAQHSTFPCREQFLQQFLRFQMQNTAPPEGSRSQQIE